MHSEAIFEVTWCPVGVEEPVLQLDTPCLEVFHKSYESADKLTLQKMQAFRWQERGWSWVELLGTFDDKCGTHMERLERMRNEKWNAYGTCVPESSDFKMNSF